MKLSVIIVNYNVRHFLEQCLLSVYKAAKGIDTEIWVVDNNSKDDSITMIHENFPHIHLIENKENVGFSRANNQAISQSKGEYVLLLNPDTVVAEDTFQKCLDFMDKTPECGGIGVKTIDGSGSFLPESKRGFPSPWVAFCKSFGLSALFPKSRFFNRYYLGHLNENEIHEIDVLVGSYMLLRRSVLDKMGFLDESFFMYGEDIDLSYRIQKQGFKNYYFPNTTIIHYKGESTKKGSLNYVRVFYGAMIIFAKKHFTGQKATVFIALMQVAVWFRAALTVLSNLLKKINLPIFDALLMFIGLYFLKDFWSSYYFKDSNYIKPTFLYFNTPIYISIWLSAIYLSGGYDKPVSLRRILRGVFVGTVVLAAFYGFLPLDLRTSRMLIVLSALWTGLSITGLRMMQFFIKNGNFRLGTEGVKNLLIVGSSSESERVKSLLNQVQVVKNIIGIINPKDFENSEHYLDSIQNLEETAHIFKIKEIIFCAKDIDNQSIMHWMQKLGNKIEYKILQENTDIIIGSSNKNTTGELYSKDISFNIALPMYRRNKRLLDISFSILCILIFPILLFFIKKPITFLKNLIEVLLGKKTLIGYTPLSKNENLPVIKPGVFNLTDGLTIKNDSSLVISKLNFQYAKDYSLRNDIEVLLRILIK